MQIPSSAVQESLTRLTDSLDQVLDETVHLCRIPAPRLKKQHARRMWQSVCGLSV